MSTDNSPRTALTRRHALGSLAAVAGGLALGTRGLSAEDAGMKLATFEADVTIPLGHPCMGGGISPATRVVDPLLARGVVLVPENQKPVVIVSVDWCEIRNDAHDRWRSALAEAAGTEPSRVLVASVHQHDAPVVDLTAERLLREAKAAGSVCDPEFHEEAVQRVARSLREGLRSARRITHVGTGKGKVEKVASNRRYLTPDGKPAFGRTSATHDAYARDQPEGTIDPWLRTLSFWDEDTPVAALSVYSTHPMSYYGRGEVSPDFVGQARARRQADDPAVFQIYLSGCSGNVTAGKYNDGSAENRPVLAERIARGMAAAWESTERRPLESLAFRSVPYRLAPRDDAGFTLEDLEHRLKTDPKPFGQCLAAMGLSWRKRVDAGRPLDLPVLDLGPALLVLLPGESYVEFQLLAQQMRPDAFVVAVGYGECATGYVPIERAFEEGDTNLHDWCWVAPGAEKTMTETLQDGLGAKRSGS
jgi:hypothetical protein